MAPRTRSTALVVLAMLMLPAALPAQPLGTFRWQLQPFCNAVVVNVVQTGAVYTVDGYDDQCGAAQRAPLVGLATPNPDGSIGFGLNVVTVPGGRGVQIDARISLATLSGTWTDSAGNSGTFAFNASTGGSPRPAPSTPASPIPPTFALLGDGGFLAQGSFGAGAIPASNAGTRMMWYPGKAAFRAGAVNSGAWDDASIGAHSAALGRDTIASGGASLALGTATTASGDGSLAAGQQTTSSGVDSVAFGTATTASGSASLATGISTRAIGSASVAFGAMTTAAGFRSVALGEGTTASGYASIATGAGTTASGATSTALGGGTTASGSWSLATGVGTVASGTTSTAMGSTTRAEGAASTAMGTYATATAAAPGSFVYGDRSTLTASNRQITSTAPNQFVVRATGGVGFYTQVNPSTGQLTAGVELAAGGGSSWAPLSDVNAKENFRDVSGEDVLAKLAGMPIQEWNYKAQDALIRHIGPTAQDFRAAFGVGDFPLRINTVDADGIALVAIQALEARTRALDDRNARLERENLELRERLARLEAAVR